MERTVQDVRGTVVGFRSPPYAQGTTVAGYHLHFLDDSKTLGGHVLDFRLDHGRITLDRDADLHVQMPTTAGPPDVDLVDADVAAEIERSENSTGGPGAGKARSVSESCEKGDTDAIRNGRAEP